MKPLNQSDLCPDVWTSIGAELDWVEVFKSGLTETAINGESNQEGLWGFFPFPW